MMKHRYKYFRWTKRTAWLTFTYVVAVPAFVGYWGYQFEVRGPLKSSRCVPVGSGILTIR